MNGLPEVQMVVIWLQDRFIPTDLIFAPIRIEVILVTWDLSLFLSRFMLLSLLSCELITLKILISCLYHPELLMSITVCRSGEYVIF